MSLAPLAHASGSKETFEPMDLVLQFDQVFNLLLKYLYRSQSNWPPPWFKNGLYQATGVARIFDWGGPNHKSHAMTSSEFSKKELFVGQRYRRMEDLKL